MDLYKTMLLLGALLCTAAVFGDIQDNYSKTEGAWIISLRRREYAVNSLEECGAKCDTETNFVCKSFMYIEKDTECWTAEDNSKTERVMRRASAALYENKAYLLECANGLGTDYRGTKARTKTGRTCQRWSGTVPHVPNFTPVSHPLADLVSDFCRNPDSDVNGPWCYTTDSTKRWETCGVPDCSEECIYCSGEDYRGKISTTASGFKCQNWDSQKPHTHGYNPAILTEKNLEVNYCRNPDGEPKPWCLTTSLSKRWEYCDIPQCTSPQPTVTPELTCASDEGKAYRGTIATTVSGKTCQPWSSQIPHNHNRAPENYPCGGLENNYCRNPDNEKMPWCYTTDSEVRWDYCQIPTCGGSARPDQPVIPTEEDNCYVGDGTAYRGTTSETISGKKCQAWAAMTPHSHSKTQETFPRADLQRNYCRNPDGDRAPWCYTTNPSVRWEFCDLEKCPSVVAPPQLPDPIPSVTTTVTESIPERVSDCRVGNGGTYRGSTSMTSAGVTCQAWSSQVPHKHNRFIPQMHPELGLERNYCRNPDDDVNGPWCYTTDRSKKWDYCQIPECGGWTTWECRVCVYPHSSPALPLPRPWSGRVAPQAIGVKLCPTTISHWLDPNWRTVIAIPQWNDPWDLCSGWPARHLCGRQLRFFSFLTNHTSTSIVVSFFWGVFCSISVKHFNYTRSTSQHGS